MTLEGDLSTLDLAALLQGLESHARTGTLTVQGPETESTVFFRDGRPSLFQTTGRPDLLEALVASGRVTEQAVANARRRRRKRPVTDALVRAKCLDPEELVALAEARLVSDLCELVHSEAGAFRFAEGELPLELFDPEETHLELGVGVEAMLLEAARRSDHWQLVRAEIPSDSAHYVVEREPHPAGGADGDLFRILRARLDGTRSVREVMAAFPHRRLEAFELLAEWGRRRLVRLARPDDLIALARRLEPSHPERAREIVARGLAQQPQHVELLVEEARLAERAGDAEAAVDALKMLAQLRAEADDRAGAREALVRARRLAPADTALWERCLALSIEEERVGAARKEGARLAELYRAPGLHKKALEVYERLVDLAPGAWDFRRERARCRVECGDVEHAVTELQEFGRTRLRAEDYETARDVYEEVLAHEPGNAGARQVLGDIRGQVYARRRRRRRRRVRRAALALGTAAILTGGWIELSARLAFSDAEAEIGGRYLIERGAYAEAIERLEAVRQAYPYTVTSWLDVRRRVAQLEAKRDAEALLTTPPPPASPPLADEATFVLAPGDAER